MIDAAFVQKIADLTQTGLVSTNDGQYSTRPLYNLPLPVEPEVSTLMVATLHGLIEFVNTQLENLDEGEDITPWLVHIRNPREVSLLSGIKGVNRQRDLYLHAGIIDDRFEFGTFMDQPDMMIQLQTRFVQTPDRDRVLRILGTVRDEHVKVSLDNGVTQRVTASAGVTLQQEVAIPNPVLLRPYRTFHEIEQPESMFVLRLEQGRAGGLPRMAIFEADGGMWKLAAIDGIRGYLEGELKDIPIIA